MADHTVTPDWTGWQDPDDLTPGLSPYLAWRRFRDGAGLTAPEWGGGAAGDASRDAAQTFVCAQVSNAPQRLLADRFSGAMVHGPDWLPMPDKLPEVPPDTVVLGVIDTGIALGNSRFRRADGSSRVLAAWQMNPMPGQAAVGVPYGRVLLRDEIDAHLAAASGGSLTGRLDEGAFNAAAGLCDLTDPLAAHDLAGRVAHGTATLDLAAGCAPGDDSAFAQRVQIIVVTLPDRRIFGTAGELLDLFMLQAVQWVADMADAIWVRSGHGQTGTAVRGFPMAVNLSFGRQAGAKDAGLDLFPHVLGQIRAQRDAAAEALGGVASALDVIMPAGNDNLDRVHAEYRLKPGEQRLINWRVPPGDRTDNFLELWARGGGPLDPSDLPLELALTPPGAQAQPLALQQGRQRNLGRIARIHCRAAEPWQAPQALQTVGVLLCLAATDDPGRPDDTGFAGLWQVTLRNTGSQTLTVHLAVQTDQGTRVVSPSAIRSYLDDPAYQRHDDLGGRRDALGYGPDGWRDLDASEGVRRHGTINASAAHHQVACVAGYRLSDGQPAPYSATGFGHADLGRGAPTVSLPTEDSPALPGLLMAGAADGSVVALRGTSFASALAARMVAEGYLNACATGAQANGKMHLVALAQTSEAKGGFSVPHVSDPAMGHPSTAKLGAGRIRPEAARTLPRRG